MVAAMGSILGTRVEAARGSAAADRRWHVRRGPRPPRRGMAHLRALTTRPRHGSRRSTRRRRWRRRVCSPSSRLTTSPSSASFRTPIRPTPTAMRRPFVAVGTVRYVGQPVVAIVAEDRALGADAADLVIVDYEPLACVVDAEAAVDGTSAAVSRARLERRDALRVADHADFERAARSSSPSESSTSG